MTSVSQEDIVKTTASATSVGPSPYEIGALFGRFVTDCFVAGNSIAGAIGSITSHVAATAGVHGVTGSVVGTTDTQTLTGKTIDTSVNTVTVAGNTLQLEYGKYISQASFTTNASTTNIAAAGTFVPIVGAWALSTNGIPVTLGVGGLVTMTGTGSFQAPYSTTISASITGAAANTTYRFTLFYNGAPLPTEQLCATNAAGVGSTSMSHQLLLITGDTFQLMVTSATTGTIVVPVAVVTIVKAA